MNILYNCYEYPPSQHGGVGTFYRDLAEALVKQGHCVTVVGIYFDNVLKLDKIIQEEINGVKIIRIPQYRKTGINRIDTFLSRVYFRHFLQRLIKKETFDFIESPEGSGWLPLGAPGNIPLVTRLHVGQGVIGLMLKRKSSHMLKTFEKMQLRRSNHIVAVSGYIANATASLYAIKKNIRVLYNGVKIPKIDSYINSHVDNDGICRILFFGSIDYKKGVKELILASLLLIGRGYNLSLSIAGKLTNKKYYTELLQLIPTDMKEKVIFCGPLNREKELFPLIAESDVCCFPSKLEAFGLAPVEAMAFRKPVVFTCLGAGPEVIRDGVDGLLCDPYNPEDIANKIAIFIDNPEMRVSCANSGYNRAWKEFSSEKMLQNNIDYYNSCIPTHR